MKTITLSILLCLLVPGCQTVNGKKYYVGPKIRFDLNVKGVGLGITLFDPLNPEDPRVIDVTPPKAGKEPVATPPSP
ncbi:MAG: hypothetical protein KA004_17380 [Verrucomicrobiales bacterium]|nr:hypothetical protein [Verrucomicrobiales bacterium]